MRNVLMNLIALQLSAFIKRFRTQRQQARGKKCAQPEPNREEGRDAGRANLDFAAPVGESARAACCCRQGGETLTRRHAGMAKLSEVVMQELISRVTNAAGIDADTAQKAVGSILEFLQKEGPGDAVRQLIDKIPNAEGLIAQAQASGGGMMGALGGMFGGAGGIMGLVGKLQGMGLDTGQMHAVGKTLIAQGRELIGDDAMARIVSSVPGLDQIA